MNVHVVFGDSGSGALRESFRQINPSYKWKIISILDLFSIGPVWQLNEEIGFTNRLDWLRKHLLREKTFSYFSVDDYESSFRSSVQELKEINKNIPITIWIGENAHDQTGLRYVCYLFQGKEKDLRVINVSQAFQKHFSRDYLNRYIPFHLGEINPEQIKILLNDNQLFQAISDNNRNRLIHEWTSLSNSTELLRVWKNGEIKSVEENHFDELFIRFARRLHKSRENNDFIKAVRLIGEVLGRIDQVVGDEFLEYRLRYLIQKGVFISQGSFDNMRSFSVQLKH